MVYFLWVVISTSLSFCHLIIPFITLLWKFQRKVEGMYGGHLHTHYTDSIIKIWLYFITCMLVRLPLNPSICPILSKASSDVCVRASKYLSMDIIK